MPKDEIRNSKLESRRTPPAVRDFTDLHAWQHARELRKPIYELTLKFPVDERFGLTSQLRRAAVSITANIAEGFGRFSFQENIQFCKQARGSAFEVRDHLTTALDQEYITKEDLQCADQLAQRVIQTLNGYIRSTKNRQSDA